MVLRGGHYDRWDLEVRGGTLGSARLFTVVEEHGAGKQLLRVRSWPRFSLLSLSLIILFAAPAVFAFHDHALAAGAILGAIAASSILRTFYECAAATASVLSALRQVEREERERNLENNGDGVTQPVICQSELACSLTLSGEPEGTGD